MISVLCSVLASTPTPQPVPESGLTAILVTVGILSVGTAFHFFKNRNK